MRLKGVIIFKIWISEYFGFFWIFINLFLILNREKGGLFSARPAEDTWRAELMWSAGPARMRRGTQGHVAEPREPAWRAGGTKVAQTPEVPHRWQGPRESTRTPERAPRGKWGLAFGGPTG